MANREHGGNIRQYLKTSNKKIIDFSANINPAGLPPQVKKIIINNADSLVHYPDPRSDQLKNIISGFHNINKTNILAGNGSIELIHLIPRALKAKNALIIGPTFSEYESAARLNKARPVFIFGREKDNFKIDIRRIKKFIPKIDLIFLCNPNNPTAAIMQKSEIIEIADLCEKHNTALVIDEAFIDFAREGEKITVLNEAARRRRFLVIRSLTKFFGLAGLRIGYLIAEQKIIKQISQFQYPWNINLLAQLAAKQALKDRHYIKSSKEAILRQTHFLWKNLERINGLKIYPPSANFIFCKIENRRIRSAEQLNKQLLKYGILIRCCNNFRGLDDRFFRVAVRTRGENKKLIYSLNRILNI